ncbi:MAG: helix-turn-helix transcriptional regulator [Nitrospinae bacterium]|nr:helix-turn-helix transcriptional regulator [Nitrospinota bacterium]
MRKAAGISQMKLAEAVGISFQQIQKYESGANKVSLEKLQKIAEALRAPLGYLIGEEGERPGFAVETEEKPGRLNFGDLSLEEMRLVAGFRGIKNSDLKKGILLLVRGAAQSAYQSN